MTPISPVVIMGAGQARAAAVTTQADKTEAREKIRRQQLAADEALIARILQRNPSLTRQEVISQLILAGYF
jgi:hypothetical protein